jgi:hypothetical protein
MDSTSTNHRVICVSMPVSLADEIDAAAAVVGLSRAGWRLEAELQRQARRVPRRRDEAHAP